jgi:hypothetical protein
MNVPAGGAKRGPPRLIRYSTGFFVSPGGPAEKIGKMQAGRLLRVPDGHASPRRRRRSAGRPAARIHGGRRVVNYDMAEENAFIRFKANTTVFSQNGVVAKLFVVSFGKKLF